MADVVQNKAGEDNRKPCYPDLPAPEVPHIGIHCLAAGDGKKYSSKDRKANYGCRMREKVQCVIWTDRGKYPWRVKNVRNTQNRKHQEPGQHDRAKEFANEACSPVLDIKERN